MPIYEYRRETDTSCEKCAAGFEAMQKMTDDPLEACPACGSPVKRVISAAAIATSSSSLSQENLERHGFTQYRKAGTGVYEKTAGKGPDTIKK